MGYNKILEVANMSSSTIEDAMAEEASLGDPTVIITGLDPTLYNAAVKGQIEPFKDKAEQLHILLTPTKNTVLHIHIMSVTRESNGSLSFVENILKLNSSLLRQVNNNGDAPLHIAARLGHFNMARFLIQYAKSFYAEIESEVERTWILLEMTNDRKETALHEAVRYDHVYVVNFLLCEDGDFPYSSNAAGETPLYLAAERGNAFLVSHILELCTSPAHGGPNGRTALHAAVLYNNEAMTQKILEKKGALIIKEADNQGWTALHYAAYFGYYGIVKMLLQFDISVAYFADKQSKRTALHIAAGRGHVDTIKEIINLCPDCSELVDNRGWNVFHFAVESNSDRVVSVMLEFPWLRNLLNHKDKEGNTPLHRIASSHSIIYCLIDNNRVDKVAFNNENLSALDLVLKSEEKIVKRQVVKHLEKYGARRGFRSIIYKEDCEEAREKERRSLITEMEKSQESHLIVAALIAAVTFAAGFTMPGGYNGNEGPENGNAILARRTAFQAFMITNTVAMVLSISAVFIHLSLALHEDKTMFLVYFGLAYLLILFAMGSMVIAFVTGTYAVLERSPGLAITSCIIACFFFLLYYRELKYRIGSAIKEYVQENIDKVVPAWILTR